MNIKFWVLFATVLDASIAANILVFLGTNLQSHFRFMSFFLEHLSPHHNITFFVDPVLKYKHANISTRDYVTPPYTKLVNAATDSDSICYINGFNMLYNFIFNPDKHSVEMLYDANIQSFLKSSDAKYNLLVYSAYLTEQFLPIAQEMNIPFVQVSPSMLLPWMDEFVDNPYQYDIDLGTDILEKEYVLLSRIKKLVKNIFLYYRFHWHYVPLINEAVLKYYPPGTQGIEEIIKRTDLIFVNTHSAMGFARANTPVIIEVGGMHVKSPKPLSSKLEKFISESGDNGFIYFSLGTLVPETLLSESKVSAIMKIIGSLPHKFLWKWKGNVTNVPANVFISKWFPQTDILGHKQIKLFITQGGMLSMQEACYNGVPVLVMPVLFDQFTNAKLAADVGYGLSLSLCDFTEEVFRYKITELLTNPSYSQKAKSISNIMQNEYPKPADKINYWINFVIRNNGTSLLRPTVFKKSWMEIIPADIFFVLIILISVLGYCLVCAYYFAKTTLPKLIFQRKLKAS